MHVFLKANGWDAALAVQTESEAPSNDRCAVGEFLDQVKAVSGLKPVTYEIASPPLVASAFKIDGGKAKRLRQRRLQGMAGQGPRRLRTSSRPTASMTGRCAN